MKIDKLHEIIENLCEDSGLDKETAYYVLDVYLEQSIEIVQTSLEDINNENKQVASVGELMHKLKGSSGNVRAISVMNLALEAETFAKQGEVELLKASLDQMSVILVGYSNAYKEHKSL